MSTADLTVTTQDKSMVKISQKFVTFSEYINFNCAKHAVQYNCTVKPCKASVVLPSTLVPGQVLYPFLKSLACTGQALCPFLPNRIRLVTSYHNKHRFHSCKIAERACLCQNSGFPKILPAFIRDSLSLCRLQ